MINRVLFSILIILTPFLLQAQEEAPSFNSYWKKGYIIESNDGNFKVKFGGRIQHDWAFFSQEHQLVDAFGPMNHQTEFRRLRFYNSGTIYNSVQYKLQVNFGGGKVSLGDVYINLKDLPVVGNLKIGHFKEPFSLDMLTSSNDVTFMEPGLPTAFKKQRNNGLQLSNNILHKRVTWAVGFFQNTDKYGKAINHIGGYNLTGRVTTLPFYDKENNRLLHLGAAFSLRNPPFNKFEITAHPESHLAPAFVKTGNISSDAPYRMKGLELALVWNSLSIQGEYISLNSTLGYNFSGYYAEVSYFLTGEHKKYSTKSGAFKRVSPKQNFNRKGEQKGFGALELALRYSTIDLSEKSGDFMEDITIGLNWHLNPVSRFSLNFILADIKDKNTLTIMQSRFQVTF